MIASHRRCYDRAEQIEDPQHLKTLEQFKREARQHRGVNSLTRAVPACELLLIRAAERGASVGGLTTYQHLASKYSGLAHFRMPNNP